MRFSLTEILPRLTFRQPVDTRSKRFLLPKHRREASPQRKVSHGHAEVSGMAEGSVDSRTFRNALGRFATGVTVVTTVAPDGVHGMTANAFTSVSLDPPLVLVSVAKQARTHEYLNQNRRFGVSILSAEQEPFAWHFAGRPRDGLKTPFVWKREVPLLQDALAHLVCRLLLEKKKGDHTLFLGPIE